MRNQSIFLSLLTLLALAGCQATAIMDLGPSGDGSADDTEVVPPCQQEPCDVPPATWADGDTDGDGIANGDDKILLCQKNGTAWINFHRTTAPAGEWDVTFEARGAGTPDPTLGWTSGPTLLKDSSNDWVGMPLLDGQYGMFGLGDNGGGLTGQSPELGALGWLQYGAYCNALGDPACHRNDDGATFMVRVQVAGGTATYEDGTSVELEACP